MHFGKSLDQCHHETLHHPRQSHRSTRSVPTWRVKAVQHGCPLSFQREASTLGLGPCFPHQAASLLLVKCCQWVEMRPLSTAICTWQDEGSLYLRGTVRNGATGQIPFAKPVGIDHETFLAKQLNCGFHTRCSLPELRKSSCAKGPLHWMRQAMNWLPAKFATCWQQKAYYLDWVDHLPYLEPSRRTVFQEREVARLEMAPLHTSHMHHLRKKLDFESPHTD